MNRSWQAFSVVLLAVFSGACVAAGTEDEPASSADELAQKTVHVTATIETSFSFLLESLATSTSYSCVTGNGLDECVHWRDETPNWLCEAARAWARPGALRSPSETTVDLLGLQGVTTWPFPRARGSVGTSTVGERIECEITAADPRTDDEFPATPVRFDIDVPASTPNLDRVDGKTYVVRFDLPDLIGSFSRKSTTGTPHYEYRAAKSAQWIEAGSYTIRYEKLRRN